MNDYFLIEKTILCAINKNRIDNEVIHKGYKLYKKINGGLTYIDYRKMAFIVLENYKTAIIKKEEGT